MSKRRIMRRILLLTTFLFTGALAAHADDGLLKWEGSLQFSTPCNGLIDVENNQRVRYYAQLTVSDPRSSLAIFRPQETELIQLTGNGQFNGNNHYDLYRIGHGDVTIFLDHNSAQPLHFTQIPQTVTSATQFVTLTGTLNNYDAGSGCVASLRAVLVRIDAD
jgi:hypothetical protein